jgi:hypothetical protein
MLHMKIERIISFDAHSIFVSDNEIAQMNTHQIRLPIDLRISAHPRICGSTYKPFLKIKFGFNDVN